MIQAFNLIENNVNSIEISYKDYNNIENILKNKLCELE
jgi:hypothetical protein